MVGPSARWRFGVFELDVRAGELRKHGIRLKVQRKPISMLSLLVERAGEMVTRDELRKALWPGDDFGDFDHGLGIALNKLRAALGDSAERPRFIETLPGRGYRLLVPVRAEPTTTRRLVAVLPFENLTHDPDQEYFADGFTEELTTQLSQSDPREL
ncbi:MAG TPA: winged helix-turn-helix domain-containing protein [Terriglobales bacterium]|nr:winged helix-turn-helix domain-containing protein [Terriglobales bacterium]